MTPEILARCVKPLEWQEPCQRNNHTNIAQSIFGDYYVHVDGGRHQAWLEANVAPQENTIGAEVGSLYEAQAAAQADYTARILAALDLDALRAEVEAMVRAERRACADVAASFIDDRQWGRVIAAAIRAREGGGA